LVIDKEISKIIVLNPVQGKPEIRATLKSYLSKYFGAKQIGTRSNKVLVSMHFTK
jgi:hypothetical protein